MEAREVVIAQFKTAHGILQQVLADVSPAALHHRLSGASIDTVASTFAHLVFAEDALVNGTALGGAPLFVTGGWAGKTGTDMPQTPGQNHDWAATVKLDLAKFMPYARAVFANTEEVLAKASDEQLAKPVQTPLGPNTGFGTISSIALYHTTEHSGEISALLGAQGLKGLPF
jgi:hypothetical protein